MYYEKKMKLNFTLFILQIFIQTYNSYEHKKNSNFKINLFYLMLLI